MRAQDDATRVDTISSGTRGGEGADRVGAVRRWIKMVPREIITDPSALVQYDDSVACIARIDELELALANLVVLVDELDARRVETDRGGSGANPDPPSVHIGALGDTHTAHNQEPTN